MLIDMHAIPAWSIALVTFLITLLCAEIGFRQGRRLRDGEKADSAWGIVESSILGLMAFLLGFAFSFANGRYETRLDLEQAEANAIGTAYMRIDLLDASAQAGMRDLFRSYVDARLELYKVGTVDRNALKTAQAVSNDVTTRIWKIATDAIHRDNLQRLTLLVQALNNMFDNGGDVEENLARRVPFPLTLLLSAAVFLAGGCVGYGFGRAGARNVSAWLLFAAITTLVVFVVVDLMRPERGLITSPHLPLVRLQESLRGTP